MKISSIATLIFLLALFAVYTGCNRAGIKFPKTYSVDVTVLKEGKPMENMVVVLFPKESIGNFSIQGETNASGVCQMKTIATAQKKSGAPKGEYKVTINLRVRTADSEEEVKQLNEWGKDKKLTEFAAEVRKRAEKRKKENDELAAVVPKVLWTTEETPITFTVDGKSKLKIDLADYVN